MSILKKEINKIWDSRENILSHYGGTASSITLKKSLRLFIELEKQLNLKDYDKSKDHLEELIINFRLALEEYNRKDPRMTTYDILTGEEV